MKGDEKDFGKYISSKRQTGENMGPLLKRTWWQRTQKNLRYWVPSSQSLLVRLAFRKPRSLRPEGKCQARESSSSLVEKDRVGEHLNKLDIYRSMGSDGMCPKVLWELVDVIARLLLVIFGRSWESEEDPKDWKKVNVTLIFRKEGLGNP